MSAPLSSNQSPSPWVDMRTVRLSHPQSGALTLRWIQLLSKNGYRKVLRTQILWSRKAEGHLFAMRDEELTPVHIEREFPLTGDQGQCQNQGAQIEWNLSWSGVPSSGSVWKQSPLSKLLGMGSSRELRLQQGFSPCTGSGFLKWGEQTTDWSGALVRSSWTAGRWTLPQWSWVSALRMQREGGGEGEMNFEGYAAPLAAGFFASSFQFQWDGGKQTQSIRGLSRAHRISGSQWEFSLESQQEKGWTFKVLAQVPQKEIALVPLEDASGRTFYSSSSLLAGASVSVYQSGKLHASFSSPNTCGLEFVSPEPNPYVRPLA